MKVIDLANSIVVAISTESSMSEVLDVLSKDPSGRVVVLKEEKPVGIVSTRDVVASFSEYGLNVINLKAKDIMSQDLVSVSPNEEVNEVVRVMLSKGIGGVPIIDNNVLVGMFTEREVLKLLTSNTFSGIIDSVMSKDVVCIGEESDILNAAKTMTRYNIRRLPVMKNDKLVGIITAADIVKFIAKSNKIGKVLDAGSKNLITVSRYEQIWRAAKVMIDKRIGTLPVIENEKLIGIVTERDLMYAFLNV